MKITEWRRYYNKVKFSEERQSRIRINILSQYHNHIKFSEEHQSSMNSLHKTFPPGYSTLSLIHSQTIPMEYVVNWFKK
jgi:hypothetical protein